MAPAPASISCPSSDGLQYTSGGSVFNIHCGQDFYGGDLALVQVSTFAQCLDTCTTTKGCIDVAYVGTNCYMKNTLTDARANTNVWGAVLVGADPNNVADQITCVAGESDGKTYTAASGAQFLIECGKDYYGGDLGLVQTSTFAQCVETCSTTQDCVDVAYNGQNCYMKNEITQARDNTNVWSAKVVATNSNSITCDGNKSNGSIYTAPSGAQFTVECGTDHYGGDFKSLPATSIEECLNACDKADGCLTVAYSTGSRFCYLKNVINDARTDANVWGATKKVVPQQSTTATTNTTSASLDSDMTKCAYWANRQWMDSRDNSWTFKCNVDAEILVSQGYFVQVINNINSMLACVEQCHVDNGYCETALWQESSQTCYNAARLIASDGTQNQYDGNLYRKPSDFATVFNAVAMPISPFTFDGVVFDDWDVTSYVTSYWNRGHYVEINSNNLRQKYGDSQYFTQGLASEFGTSWPREVHIFYRDNGNKRLLDCLESDRYIIRPGAIQYPGTQRDVVDPIPSQKAASSEVGQYLRIWDVAWGLGNIPASLVAPSLLDKFYDLIWTTDEWQVNRALINNWDSRYGLPKVAVIWVEYLNTPGIITQVHGYEYSDMTSTQFGRPSHATN